MKFTARVNPLVISVLVFWGVMLNLFVFLYVYDKGWTNKLLLALIPNFIFLIAYPLFALYNTVYKIKDDILYCISGVIRVRIPISKIEIIYTNVDLPVVVLVWDEPVTQLQPSLHNEGLIIKYGKYDWGFVSPKEEEALIQQLQILNGRIKIDSYKNYKK